MSQCTPMSKCSRGMWRAGAAKWAVGAALLGAGGGAAAIAASDDPSTSLKICTIIPQCLFRDTVIAATIAFDYKYSFWGLQEGSPEWLKVRHEVHNRCAHRIQELCFRNGGIYIKLGQHIGQLEYVVPQEYVQKMRASMLKRCPISSYDQVCSVFMKELGHPPENVGWFLQNLIQSLWQVLPLRKFMLLKPMTAEKLL